MAGYNDETTPKSPVTRWKNSPARVFSGCHLGALDPDIIHVPPC